MAKAKSRIAKASMEPTWDDKEPGKRRMLHVIATHLAHVQHAERLHQAEDAMGALRERMPDATLLFTGAGPGGGINGFAARNVPISAIALSLHSGTAAH